MLEIAQGSLDITKIKQDIGEMKSFWYLRNKKFREWYEILILIDALKAKNLESYVSSEPQTFYNMAHYLLTKGELSHLTPVDSETAVELDRKARVNRACGYMWTKIDEERKDGGNQSFIDELGFYLLVLGWYSTVLMFDKDTGMLQVQVWNPYDTYPRYANNKMVSCTHSYKMGEREAGTKAESNIWSYAPRGIPSGEVTLDDYFYWEGNTLKNIILIDGNNVSGSVERPEMKLLVAPVGGFPDRGSLTPRKRDWRQLTGRGIFEVNEAVLLSMNKWKCVHPDTYVWIYGEGLVPIIEAKIGQYSQSTSGRDRIDATSRTEITDAYEITTYQGFHLICSGEHRFLQPDGTFLRACELKVNSPIVTSFNNKIYGDSPVVAPYILGLLIGDGSFATEGYIGFTNKSYEKCKLVADMFSGSIKEQDGLYQVNAFSYRDTIKDLWGIPMESIKANQKEIPACILKAGMKEQLLFIRGLFETDGYSSKGNKVVAWDMSSYKLLCQLQLLLVNFGILARLSELPRVNAWRLQASGNDANNFFKDFYPERYDPSYRISPQGIHRENSKRYYKDGRWVFEDRASIIKKVKGGLFADLSIQNRPNYVANGIITHNTMVNQILRDTAQPITQEFAADAQATPERLRERGAHFHYSPGEGGLSRVPPAVIPIEVQANLMELRRELQKGSFNDAVYGMVEGQPGYALSLLSSSSANQILYPYMDAKHFVVSQSDKFWLGNLKTSKRVFEIKGKLIEKLKPTDIPDDVAIMVESNVATPKDWLERGTIANMLKEHLDESTIITEVLNLQDPQAIKRRKSLDRVLSHPMSQMVEMIAGYQIHADYLDSRGDARQAALFRKASKALEGQLGVPPAGQAKPEQMSEVQAEREAGTPEEKTRVRPEISPPEARTGFTPTQLRQSVGRGTMRSV